MPDCNKCSHFRRVRRPSQLFAQAVGVSDAALSNALARIMEDEEKQRDVEARVKLDRATTGKVEWGYRPIMSGFCGLRESEDIYLVHEVKNAGKRCTDHTPGRPDRHSCSTCVHRIAPQGTARDFEMEQTYVNMRRRGLSIGISVSTPENLLSKHHEGIGPRKGLEVANAYGAKGILGVRPQYLDYCEKLSSDDEYVVCLMHNLYDTCGMWEPVSDGAGYGHRLGG